VIQRHDSRWFILFLAAVTLAVPAAAQASDQAVALRLRAAQLASTGQCEAALPLLERARGLAQDDTSSTLLAGQCLYETKQYAESLPRLQEASRANPNSADAAMYLGMANYQLGNVADAEAALARADELDPNRAEVALYKGLVLLDQRRSDEASEQFERASTYGPDRVEPMASYYGGLAHAAAGRESAAEASLRRASELAPGSEWDRQAQAALAGSGGGSAKLRRWLTLQGGVDYDSNVGLLGDDVVTPGTISDESDGRGWWGANGGAELFRKNGWGGGIRADYFGSAYFRETEFNNHSVSTGVWVDREVGENTLLRFQPIAGFSWYNRESYLNFYGAVAEVLQNWGSAGSGNFYARYSYDDYRYDIPGASSDVRRFRNRDGHRFSAGYDHSYDISSKTTVYGGPYGLGYSAKGGEWDHWGVGFWAGIYQQLPWRFAGRIEGGYAYHKYDNPSSYLQPGEGIFDRHDHIGRVRVEIERPITEWLTVAARWLYYNSGSNTDVFDYDRHIAGVYFTIPVPLGN
jgi:tetratricopeptide (TPR) repeat protein